MASWFQALGLGLALLLILELMIVAARASLLSPNTLRVLSGLEPDPLVNRALDLARRHAELEAALHLALLLSRLLLAGCILAFLPAAANIWVGAGEALAALLLSGIFLFLVEEFVEALVIRSLDRWALRLAPFAAALQAAFAPLLAVAMAFHHPGGSDEIVTVTENELKSLVDAGHQEGLLEKDEREMIYSIFQLGDTLVREIMVPRTYLTALDVEHTIEEAMEQLLASGYSRLPVYEENVDRVIGVLYTKDLLRAWKHSGAPLTLRGLLRPAYFVPEAKRVDELLEEMQARRVHMAIVVDEYGGVAGLVTLEDIVEEIVGEIRDEFDQAEELPYQPAEQGGFMFLGRVDLDEFNEVMHAQFPRDEAETLGGFVYNQLGRVPVSGESLQVGDIQLIVEQVSGRRIRKVRAVRLIASAADEQEEQNG